MQNGFRYEAVEGWEQLPSGFTHRDVCGVTVDSKDRVYLVTRGDARVIVYEADGTFVKSWGEDTFTERTHGVCIDADDNVYVADDGDHTVRKFTPEGKELMVLGTANKPSDTGYDGSNMMTITKGAGPFNRPTGVSLAPNGDIYVSDGYGNAQVHHFSADGKLVRSWGEPGNKPGQFYLPHDVCVTADERVLVADRENDRIQIFTLAGEFVDQWTHVQRPTGISCDPKGNIYVSSLWWRVGQKSQVHGERKQDLPGHVSVLDNEGNLLLSWVSADRCAPGNFVAPHSICADSRGDIYVGEVTHTFGVTPGLVPADCHMFQKLERKAT